MVLSWKGSVGNTTAGSNPVASALKIRLKEIDVRKFVVMLALALGMSLNAGAAGADNPNRGQVNLHSDTKVSKGYTGNVHVTAFLNPRTPVKFVIKRRLGGYRWVHKSETVETGYGNWQFKVPTMEKKGRYVLKVTDQTGKYGVFKFNIKVTK